MSAIYMVINELEEEERENESQPEPENWKRPQKRMLFTFKNCGCCKKEMTNTKGLDFVMRYVIATCTVQNEWICMIRNAYT